MASWLIILGLISGQIIKIPPGTEGGATILDLTVLGLDLSGLIILKFKLKKPPLWIKTLLIFTVIAVISLVLTPLNLSLSEYGISFGYTLRLGAYVLLGWIIYSGAYKQLKENVDLTLIISGIILATLGLLQLIFVPTLIPWTEYGWDPHYYRVFSTLLDPNFAGGFFVLTLILLINRLTKNPSKVLIIGSLITAVAAIATFSRSVGLMLGTCLLVLAIFSNSKALRIAITIIIIIFIASFTVYSFTASHADRWKSASYRLISWQQGINIVEKSPFLGIGFNSYRYALRQFHLAEDNYIQGARSASGSDSSLIFVAATTGIVGLGAYLAFIFILLKQSWQSFQKGQQLGLVLLAGLSGLLIHSVFINSLFYPWFLIWIILIGTKLSSHST